MINPNTINGISAAENLGLALSPELVAARLHVVRVRLAVAAAPDLSKHLAVVEDPSSTDAAVAKAVADFRTAQAASTVRTEPLILASESAVERSYKAIRAELTDAALALATDAMEVLNRVLPTLSINGVRGGLDATPRDERRARIEAEDAIDVLCRVWGAVWDIGLVPQLIDANGHALEVAIGEGGFALMTDVGPEYLDYRNSPNFDLTLASLHSFLTGNSGITLKAQTVAVATATVASWSEGLPKHTASGPGMPARPKTPLELAETAVSEPEARDGSWTAVGSV